MDIRQTIPPLQIEGLLGDDAIRQIAVYVETELRRMQEELYTIRQFIEPLVVNNDNCPDQALSPLQ